MSDCHRYLKKIEVVDRVYCQDCSIKKGQEYVVDYLITMAIISFKEGGDKTAQVLRNIANELKKIARHE